MLIGQAGKETPYIYIYIYIFIDVGIGFGLEKRGIIVRFWAMEEISS